MSRPVSIPRVLHIHRPASAGSPLVLDSPHSGHDFPDDFGSVLSVEELRTAEDSFVHELWAGATQHGAHLLEALFPRSYIDPNRSAGDIDLELLDGPWPHRYEPSGKARLGNALVWRLLDDGTTIYAGKLSAQTVVHRIENYLNPYQAALKDLLDLSGEEPSLALLASAKADVANPAAGICCRFSGINFLAEAVGQIGGKSLDEIIVFVAVTAGL